MLKGLYTHEDGSVKEGKIFQVNIQIKYHLCHYSLLVGWLDPTNRKTLWKRNNK